MELSSLSNAVSAQASAQASAMASLLLLRKTLELQAASIDSLLQSTPPATPASNPPNLGTSVDVMA